MSDNKYSWNKTLKFSWGHIVAFVALIFISYVAYMGIFYSNGGDFKASAIKVGIIDVALIIVFIGAQLLKGTEGHFNRSIIIERIFVILCPIVFVITMIPYNHFWSVFSKRDEIVPRFTSAIEKSRQMFTNYDQYSKERITHYTESLSRIIDNREGDVESYLKAGFGYGDDNIIKDNYIATLQLQLLSQNTDSLRNLALLWINNANQGASVWNAFLVGNLDKISTAIQSWNQMLYETSSPTLSNEGLDSTYMVKSFDPSKESFNAANRELNSLRDLFMKSDGISFYTIITGCVLFLMLMFPYFLQKRNTRATGLYFLLPQIKTRRIKTNRHDIVKEKEETTEAVSNSKQSDGDLYGGTF